MNWRLELRLALMEYFSESDLRSLCFDLDVDYETLSTDNKTETVIDLIDYFSRQDRIPELIAYCSQYRPNVQWDRIAAAATEEEADKHIGWPLLEASSHSRTGIKPQTILVAAMAILLVALGLYVAYQFFAPESDSPPKTDVRDPGSDDPIQTDAPPPATNTAVSTTHTPVPATETVGPTPAPTLIPRRILYSSNDTYHLGDEEVEEWTPRAGVECLDVGFTLEFLPRTLTLELETFGVEAKGPISLNGREIAGFPIQVAESPNERPNIWSEVQEISIPTDDAVLGYNVLKICAELNPRPDFVGDIDDLQLRNVRLVAN